jgi:hypothetical protein
VALHRDIEGAEPLRSEPAERLVGHHELRPADARHIATGTLACPECDAPVLPGPGAMLVADPFSCAFCSHTAAVRDFLSLAEPTRPTRVAVRVRGPAVR